MKVHHLNILATEADHIELNRVGWDGHPRFKMHADITFGDLKAAQAAFIEGAYKHVATIETTSMEQAFELTNSIQWPWQENTVRVRFLHMEAHADRARSTSVGDIIENDGEFFMVAGFGFERLDAISKAA